MVSLETGKKFRAKFKGVLKDFSAEKLYFVCFSISRITLLPWSFQNDFYHYHQHRQHWPAEIISTAVSDTTPNTESFVVRIFLLRKSPYSVRLRENMDPKKFLIWTLSEAWTLLSH